MNKPIRMTPEEIEARRVALIDTKNKSIVEEEERIRLVQEARKIRFDVDMGLFGSICQKGFLEYLSPDGKWNVAFAKNDILTLMMGGVVSKDCGQKTLEFRMPELTRDQKISVLKYSTLYQDLVNIIE